MSARALGRSGLFRRAHRCLGAILLVLTFLVRGGIVTHALAAVDAGAHATASARAPAKPPLQPLPRLPALRLDAPSAADKELLDALLTRLTSSNGFERESALADLLEVTESMLPAVRARIDAEAERANRAAMKQTLLDIRAEVRQRLEREQRAAGKQGEVETPDYLHMVVAEPRLTSDDWKQLTRVLALSRICVAIGSVSAVRQLIHVFVRFEFLRIDTQLQLAKLDENALAALIESTRHPAPAVAEWAKRRLDFMGKAIPSEAVRVNSPDVLADVLRAYGRLEDPDAARLVLSFASSERSQVRLAARQAIAAYGDTAIWVLRDGYEQLVGEKAPREWSWDRLARELFREFDRNRLAEVYALYERGLQASADNNYELATQRFHQLLNRSPDFEPKDAIANAMLSFARAAAGEQEQAGEAPDLALQRVIRIGSENQQREARSLLLTLKARRLAARGLADQFILRQALDLDPNNQQARQLLEELETEPLSERTGFQRWLWPSVLGAMSLVFLVLLIVGRRRAQAPAPP